MPKYFSLSEWYFLNGIKRTCLNYPNFSKFEYMKQHYPYINKNDLKSLGDHYLFFQNEELKEEMMEKYIKGNEHVSADSAKHHWIIGNILEYPPKAIEFYINNGKDHYPERTIGIQYCGNHIISDVLDLKENAKWFWEKYPYPLDDTLLIRRKEYFNFIDFHDYKKIELIIENVKSALITSTL